MNNHKNKKSLNLLLGVLKYSKYLRKHTFCKVLKNDKFLNVTSFFRSFVIRNNIS